MRAAAVVGFDVVDACIVHDLGISGDDFGDFYETVTSYRPTEKRIPAEFVPTEHSRDSCHVTRKHSWLAEVARFV